MTQRQPSATDLPTRWPTPKVVAGTGGAGAGGVVALFVIGMLDDHVYNPAVTGDVPGYVQALIFLLAPALVAGLAGWFTPRSIQEVAPFRRRGEHEADT
ncbi:hypothetical protein [Nocardioides marmoraquaticus]